MFFNIVENAILHSNSAEAIQICVYVRDGNCVLEITDKGPGIDRGDQAHIFKRFYRSDQPNNRRGSGLGLYIAKGFAHAFGGSIMVVSPIVQNTGTTMLIRLPLAPAQELETAA